MKEDESVKLTEAAEMLAKGLPHKYPTIPNYSVINLLIAHKKIKKIGDNQYSKASVHNYIEESLKKLQRPPKKSRDREQEAAIRALNSIENILKEVTALEEEIQKQMGVEVLPSGGTDTGSLYRELIRKKIALKVKQRKKSLFDQFIRKYALVQHNRAMLEEISKKRPEIILMLESADKTYKLFAELYKIEI